ncbi:MULTISPECIES: anti-sigma factor [Flavobacterium]|uniref:Anti-sigma factor n=1 Tax=Flavobacterium sedimenticola TaxID=3043286 RepID=A0ABT6XTP8_9FLAO|nr:anti-sigma factor [Flavobacterium sedimenticola]MDI9258367.1 anti-sigma factor [Flavobacterium sedimenticola]
MEAKEYIESGVLELYVYGLLTEAENDEVNAMANRNPEIKAEIIAIEKAIINLSSSFSPFLSHSQFEKIKAQLELKHGKVVTLKAKTKWTNYIGWAASIALLIGIGYQYSALNENKTEIKNIQLEKNKLQQTVVELETQNKETNTILSVIRDAQTKAIPLGGQAIDPSASAKVYWNQEQQVVYVDASGLPEPPEGMVYQVWALKLNPLTPTSIGLLENFTADRSIFKVDHNAGAEAFGITLEPAGGSPSPTLEKLYTLGKV